MKSQRGSRPLSLEPHLSHLPPAPPSSCRESGAHQTSQALARSRALICTESVKVLRFKFPTDQKVFRFIPISGQSPQSTLLSSGNASSTIFRLYSVSQLPFPPLMALFGTHTKKKNAKTNGFWPTLTLTLALMPQERSPGQAETGTPGDASDLKIPPFLWSRARASET